MKRISLFFIVILVAFASCKDKPKAANSNIDETLLEGEATDSLEIEIVEEPVKLTIKQLKDSLVKQGFKVFDYVDETTQDTILMQQYYMVLLRKSEIMYQNEEEEATLQKEHMAHLDKMYELGYADLSGPVEDDSDIAGITVYNVPNLKIADSLANADPMVIAGRLKVEVHPWWSGKGYGLR